MYSSILLRIFCKLANTSNLDLCLSRNIISSSILVDKFAGYLGWQLSTFKAYSTSFHLLPVFRFYGDRLNTILSWRCPSVVMVFEIPNTFHIWMTTPFFTFGTFSAIISVNGISMLLDIISASFIPWTLILVSYPRLFGGFIHVCFIILTLSSVPKYLYAQSSLLIILLNGYYYYCY